MLIRSSFRFIRSSFLRLGVLWAVGLAVCAGPVFADPPPFRVFVSSNGSDANTATGCTRLKPCRSFQVAIGAVAAGGEVVALDSGDYAPMTIDRAVTVTSENAHAVIVSRDAYVNVIAPSGAVVLRNLRFVNAGAVQYGIAANAGSRLYLENLVVTGFVAFGVLSNGGDVILKDVAVRENGFAGIGVYQGTAVLDGVRTERNPQGIMIQAAALTLRNSLVTENSEHGLVVWAFSGETVAVDIEQSQIAKNAVGINAFTVGGTTTVRVAASRIVGNGIGLDAGAGAGLLSFGNNRLAGNGTDGAFTARIAEE